MRIASHFQKAKGETELTSMPRGASGRPLSSSIILPDPASINVMTSLRSPMTTYFPSGDIVKLMFCPVVCIVCVALPCRMSQKRTVESVEAVTSLSGFVGSHRSWSTPPVWPLSSVDFPYSVLSGVHMRCDCSVSMQEVEADAGNRTRVLSADPLANLLPECPGSRGIQISR